MAPLSGGHHPHAEKEQYPDAAQDQIDRVESVGRLELHAACEERGRHGHNGVRGERPGHPGLARVLRSGGSGSSSPRGSPLGNAPQAPETH